MAMSNALELALLRLLAGNTTDTILDDIGSGIQESVTAGSLYLSLHTADVGEAGSQTTSETTYDDYERKEIPRTLAGGDDWTVAANVLSNTDDLLFPEANAGMVGSQVIKFWAIGTDATGAGNVLFKGAFVQAPTVFTAKDVGVAGSDLFTSYSHGLTDGDEVLLFTTPGASSLPGGFAEGTTYVVIFVDFDTFRLGTTGAPSTPINITADGAGWVARLNSLTVNAGVQPKITAGTLQVQLH